MTAILYVQIQSYKVFGSIVPSMVHLGESNLRPFRKSFSGTQNQPISNAGYPHNIPLNQIPLKYYNGNQRFQNYRDCKHTCNCLKFEIPALQFPRKDPVNPCKHLQCRKTASIIFFKS